MQNCLSYSRAFWLKQSLIAWNVDIGDGSCYLYASKDAKLSVSLNEITGTSYRFE